MHMSELLASLEAPVYIERVALGNNKQVMTTADAQCGGRSRTRCKGLGFSLVEVLSPCPTIWKMDPLDAQRCVLEEMPKTFPLGVFRDRTKDAPVRPAGRLRRRGWRRLPAILGLAEGGTEVPREPKPAAPRRRTRGLRSPGFGGQGVLMLGEVLAEAGLDRWPGSLLAAVLRSGNALGHFQLSRAAFHQAHRFAAGVACPMCCWR